MTNTLKCIRGGFNVINEKGVGKIIKLLSYVIYIRVLFY